MPRIPQAGAIAVTTAGAEPLFLIVTAKKDPGSWIFPKGHIEPGEKPADAAIRELREETGVAGELIGVVGASSFRSGLEEVDVTYFLIRSLEEHPALEGRRLEWLPFLEARNRLSHADSKTLLDRATEILAGR